MSTTIIGIDVGKQTCHLAHTRDGKEIAQLTAPHEQAAAEALRLAGNAPALIALELTGSLALPIIHTLEASGANLDIRIANHTDSFALRQLLRHRRKTDSLDARLICKLAALSTHPDTAPLTAAHLTPWPAMRAAILGRANVRHLQALTRHSTRLKLQRQAAHTPEARANLSNLLAATNAAIKAANSQLLIDAAHSPTAQLLTTIPGVKLRLAALLEAAIGDVHRFPTPDHLVKYCGVVPPHRPASGASTGHPIRHRSITLLHTDLHMFGLRVASDPPKHGPIGATYQRVRASHNGNGRIAGWAAKRQLIRICWGVLTSGQPYRQPASPTNAPPGERPV
jgi:transposase